MKKISEVLRLRFSGGATTRKIAGSCKLAVSAVSEFLYRAGAAGYSWPLPEGLSDGELEKFFFLPAQDPARVLAHFRTIAYDQQAARRPHQEVNIIRGTTKVSL